MGNYDAPAGHFSRRITVAHALGLISTRERESIDLVREARNDAAHFKRGQMHNFGFGSWGIQEKMSKLVTSPEILEVLGADGPTALLARLQFDCFCFEMVARLALRLDSAKRLPTPDDSFSVVGAFLSEMKSLAGPDPSPEALKSLSEPAGVEALFRRVAQRLRENSERA